MRAIAIRVVPVGGMTIGTLFTLLVVPAVYAVSAKDHRAEQRKQADEPELGAEPAAE